MKPRRMQLLAAGAAALLCALALWHWSNAPQAPDVRTADFGEVIGFMGSADYSRMYTDARADYARGVAARVQGLLLDRFYRLSPAHRGLILQTLALAWNCDADHARGDYRRLVTRHPPRVQAMRTQFAIDLQRQQHSRRP